LSGNKNKTLNLSVGALIEFSARTGDLFADIPVGPTSREGILGHQKIQKSRGKAWQAEYSLKQTLALSNYKVRLQGRLDLLNQNVEPVVIEELKTSYTSPDNIPEEKKSLHLAQAKVYGYLYYLERAASDLAVGPDTQFQIAISWYDLTTNELFTEQSTYTAVQLKDFTESLLTIYLDWYMQFNRHREKVVRSAKALEFPFTDYRENQHNFARHVYQTVKDKQQLLVEAPTGTGKTMSTLFPVCKALGESLIEQVVYLTAKGSAQETARKSLGLMQTQELDIDYLVIQAKDKACPCRSTEQAIKQTCDNGDGKCSRTVGFFDRLPAARLACLKAKTLDKTTLDMIASDFQLCPFELSLQMIRWSSVVICDFNYFLDPMVRLAVFEENKNRRAVLIDEIHNLPDRAREMYSATLSAKDTRQISKQLSDSPALKNKVLALARAINRLATEELYPIASLKAIRKSIDQLLEIVSTSDVNTGFGSDLGGYQPTGFTDWLKSVYRFVFISELFDDSHIALASDDPSSDTKSNHKVLRLMCLDAAHFLAKKYQSARSIVGFSATLAPLDFYLSRVGFQPTSKAFSLPPVFPADNLLTLRCDYIDTRWQHRAQSIQPLCQLFHQIFEKKTGKYLVFFPSYQYMNQCFEWFHESYPHYFTVIQQRSSNEQQRQTFLDKFFKGSQATIGFAILGGVFGEGVDFAGDALDGAIVIGTGMPQPSTEQKLIEQYYVDQGFNGFQFAYQFPGFTRVKQTAGRVIRSENDRGIVVLVDPRFKRKDYQSLMPFHWNVSPCKNIEDVAIQVDAFWQNECER